MPASLDAWKRRRARRKPGEQNRDTQPRELIQFGYRAAWAGPVRPVEEWDPELVANPPAVAKPYLQSPNTTGAQFEQEHKPKGMRTEAESINPSRWEQA